MGKTNHKRTDGKGLKKISGGNKGESKAPTSQLRALVVCGYGEKGFSMEMAFPRHGNGNLKFLALMGVFPHAPMANPPIYASSDDARNDRGVRPLRMRKP